MTSPHEPSDHPDLRRALRSLYGAPEVPESIDEAVLERARRRLGEAGDLREPGTLAPRLMRALPIAASLLFVLALGYSWITRESNGETELRAAEDFDRNGQVNIRDAFLLARALDAGRLPAGDWDLDGDGQVNALDVERIASAAVSLGS